MGDGWRHFGGVGIGIGIGIGSGSGIEIRSGSGSAIGIEMSLILVEEEAASSAVCGEVWETWRGAEKSFETSPFHLERESWNKCSSSEART